MKVNVLRNYTCQKDFAGNRFELTIKEGLNKTEMSYKVIKKGKSLDQFSMAEQEVFRKMESDLAENDAVFNELAEQLNRL